MKSKRSIQLLLIFVAIMLFNVVPVFAVSRDEAVAWLKYQGQNGVGFNHPSTNYGYQCTDFVSCYMNWLVSGDPYSYNYVPYWPYQYPDKAAAQGDRWEVIRNYAELVPEPGDIFVSAGGSSTGHIGTVVSSDVNHAWVVDQDGNHPDRGASYHYITWTGSYAASWYIRYKQFSSPEKRGNEMSSGYDRAIPDGDYMIACAADPSYFLDISGGDMPAAEGTNVNLWHTDNNEIGDCDAWTVKYENGFYRISQYGHSRSLDVDGADTLNGKNVHVWGNNSSSAQKWAISRNGRNGYRLQAKCSGYSLDVTGGTLSSGTNIQQWEGNDSNAQSWIFIPYKPSQPVGNGRYVLLYTANNSYELDIPGDTGNVENGIQTQLWNDSCPSQYNSFDLTKLSNGFYKVKHAASGKCLDVNGASRAYKTKIVLYSDNGSIAQQWAIVKNGSGYALIAKCNGYALDLPDGTTGNGNNPLEAYPVLLNNNQRWTFVQAEHKVSFNANNGSGEPSAQTKYYKNDLTLSSSKPTRNGYSFKNWNTKANGSGISYDAGSSYKIDADVTLYAQWEPLTYTITYNANGGAGAPSAQTKAHGTSLILSSTKPTRAGYVFKSWNTRKGGSGTNYSSGANYTADADVLLYAQWEANTYKVSYDANGGTGAPSAQTKTHGKSLTLSSSKPTRTGYTFKNWNTKANGSGNTYESGATYSSDADVTLYAQWNGQTKTITFNANGGTLKGASERKVEYGKQYGELPVPTWNGHKFLGWFTTTSGNTSVSASTVCTSDITLYAHWKEDPDSCEHEYKETGTVAPTCGKDGSRTYTCKHCGNKKTEKIPATGDHKWGEWTVSSEATCVKKGLRKHKCLVCGKEETDEIQETGIHEYGSWKTVKEATITEEGSRTRKCINCSATETETIPVISHEHKWGEWTVKKEATCEKPGLSVRTCSGCGNKEEKDIPATGHKWGDWTLVTPATDEKDGVEVRICENDSTHVESRKTDKREVTVKVTSIKIVANLSTTICAGKKVSLSATVSPKNAAQTVTWKSSNKNYVTVTSKGVVTTKKAGIGKTVIITAKAKDGSGKTAKIRIKIVKDGVTKIKLKGKTTKPAGKQLTIKATVTAGKTANTELKWISSNKEYATVNKNGVVTLKEAGKGKYVRITAMATDGTGVKGSIKIKIT